MTDLGAVPEQLKAERAKLDRVTATLSELTGKASSRSSSRRFDF